MVLADIGIHARIFELRKCTIRALESNELPILFLSLEFYHANVYKISILQQWSLTYY